MASRAEFLVEMARQQAERDAFTAEIQETFDRTGRFTIETDYGRTWVLTRNMRTERFGGEAEVAPYRITFFDGKEPTGHIEVRSIAEAAREMGGRRRRLLP